MAMTISVVKKIVENCGCPQISSPDDMIIGACLKRLHIENVHSSLFHQVNNNPRWIGCNSVNNILHNYRHDRLTTTRKL